MKSIFALVFILFSSVAYAMPQHFTPIPPNGTLYLNQAECPGECFPLVKPDGTMLDLDTVTVESKTESVPVYKDGNIVGTELRTTKKLVEDVAKKTQKAERRAAKEAQELADKESRKTKLKGLKTIAELKDYLQELVEKNQLKP